MGLRVLYQLCRALGDDDDLRAHTEQARSEPGCSEAECYRGFEFPENIAIVELWDDEFVYSDHWKRELAGDKVFATLLRSDHQRRIGDDGAEFYRQTYHASSKGVWTPPDWVDKDSRISWPGGGRVRIIGQHTRKIVEDTLPRLAGYSIETRREPGCIQFEHFHSIEFDPDTLTLELWQDQVIYDLHWQLRAKTRITGATFGSAGGSSERPDRLQGTNGYEFYQQLPFQHLYDRWLPIEPSKWSESVTWSV